MCERRRGSRRGVREGACIGVAIFGDEEEFYAHISLLPPSAQLSDPITAAEDPHNYLGRFAVVAVSPEPCATGAEATLVTMPQPRQ